jgi:hypothetical protein
MHKNLIVITGIIVLAIASASSAWAGWGCGFTGSDIKGNFGSIWGSRTEKEARATALRFCRQDHRGCYVVGCRNNVNTKEHALALWPMKGRALRDCGGPHNERC